MKSMRLRHIILFLLMAVFVTPIRAGIHTDYLLGGNYVYNNGSQWYLKLDCGEVSLTGSTSASSYYYDLKDYQGNVRMAVRSGSSSHFMTDYYPYGGVIRKGRIGTHHRLFIGKELDKMHGLNWYDFEARMYDPTLGRFMTMDRMAEKYYPLSPYAYCGNNPVRYIDEHGDSLSLSGSEENVNSTLNVYNQGMGGYYQASINKNGIVTLCANKNVDFANMTEQERAVYTQLKRVIDSQHMTTINIENNSSEVIIGNAKSATIDIGDINALKGLTQSGPVAALMHETNEQSFLQNPNFRSNDEYRVVRAHAAAEGLEHSYTGNIGVTNILDINSNNNSGFLRFMRGNSVIESKKIINGNF